MINEGSEWSLPSISINALSACVVIHAGVRKTQPNLRTKGEGVNFFKIPNLYHNMIVIFQSHDTIRSYTHIIGNIIMFILSFRQIEQSDVDRDCRFLPESHEYEMHLQAIIEDIGALNGVTSVKVDENDIFVNAEHHDMQSFKSVLKPLLQCHYCFLRLNFPIREH